MKPTFFATPAHFRRWLQRNHGKAAELLVGFWKKDSGKPSITWPESVDEALCFGWIDGVRKRIDDVSYTIRFTPRRRGSIWSAINIKRATELTTLGRMTPAGLRAFEARDEKKSAIYSYENRPRQLAPEYETRLRANEKAWEYWTIGHERGMCPLQDRLQPVRGAGIRGTREPAGVSSGAGEPVPCGGGLDGWCGTGRRRRIRSCRCRST